MAVFMLNVCKFNSCGLTFKSLGHLIQHIEETHIDYDPHVVEKTEQQQPACIPLSYVLRFLTDAARRENINKSVAQPTNIIANHHHNHNNNTNNNRTTTTTTTGATTTGTTTTTSISSSQRVRTTADHNAAVDDYEEQLIDDTTTYNSEPEDDSNDSWTTLEEFSSEYILRYASRNAQNLANTNIREEKPFACPVPGCKKRYKNVNGIKYHSKNGHKNDGKVRKQFKCPCGKSYKTTYGLKNHTAIRHNNNPPTHKSTPQGLKSNNNHQPDDYKSNNHHHQLPKIPKLRVPAMQDHGYIKQVYPDTESECESGNNLGVLTPASSPSSTKDTIYQKYSSQSTRKCSSDDDED